MLQATTLLGDNTIPILRSLLDDLCQRGHEFTFDEELPADERVQMVRSGRMDIVFACGLLTMELIAEGTPIDVLAVPLFPGETEPVYRSVVVTTNESTIQTIDDAVAGRLAVNEYGSWSGWRAWELHLAEHGHNADEHPTHIVSGGHVHSMALVQRGIADVATIDSSIWSAAGDDARRGLRVIDHTRDWPAPPLSCVRSMSDPIRGVIEEAIHDSSTWQHSDGSPHRIMLD